MTVLSKSRMESVVREGDVVTVRLTDGRTVEGSHCLLALGSVPNTTGIGLEEVPGWRLDGGFVQVDRVSRTSARGVYAAGDCTGIFMLASVAAMQGRIAMWHFLGDAVALLDLKTVSANVFTAPETHRGMDPERRRRGGDPRGGGDPGQALGQPAGEDAGRPRRLRGARSGRPGTGIVVGAPWSACGPASLIHPVAIAVSENLTADQLAHAFTVYPSMSGSVVEAASPAPLRGLEPAEVPAAEVPAPAAAEVASAAGAVPTGVTPVARPESAPGVAAARVRSESPPASAPSPPPASPAPKSVSAPRRRRRPRSGSSVSSRNDGSRLDAA